MSATTASAAPQQGARITLKQIEDEVFKSPLTKVENKGKSLTGKQNQKIEGFDFVNNGKKIKMLNIIDCQDVVIRRCRLSGTDLLDVMLCIDGAKTKRIIFEYCIIENASTKLSNGGEPIRLGNSARSGCFFDCIIRNSIFRNLNADPETISVKSCGNQIYDNYFIDNKSMVTVRHGGLADIHHNTFIGNNGVRLLGYGSKAHNNLHKDNSATDKMSPYQVQYGTLGKDPNWFWVNEKEGISQPSGKNGSSHSAYAQCVDNEIFDNEYVNCKNEVFIRKGEPLAPKNLKIVELQTPTTPPEPPKPEEPEEPVEPPSTLPECSICHKEAASKKLTLTVNVGKKHYEPLRSSIVELLREMRAEEQEQGGEEEGGVQQ